MNLTGSTSRLLALTGMIIIFGCDSGPGTVPVSGLVTHNGQAVEKTSVTFLRVEGEKGPVAAGATDQAGRFQLHTGRWRGAMPGSYLVLVQKDTMVYLEFPDPMPDGMGRSEYMRAHNIIPQQLLPPVYADLQKTPLRAEVVPRGSDNYFEFHLEGPAPTAPSTPRGSVP